MYELSFVRPNFAARYRKTRNNHFSADFERFIETSRFYTPVRRGVGAVENIYVRTPPQHESAMFTCCTYACIYGYMFVCFSVQAVRRNFSLILMTFCRIFVPIPEYTCIVSKPIHPKGGNGGQRMFETERPDNRFCWNSTSRWSSVKMDLRKPNWANCH